MTTQTEHLPVTGNDFFTRKPGGLIQKGNLMLHTKVGMGYGRELLHIAERLRTLWQAAKDNNPYADLYLLQLEDTMLTARHELKRCEKQYQQQLMQYPDIQLELVTSQNPLVMQLYFLNIYSFRTAILIGHFDRLARYALSLQNITFDIKVPLSQVLQELGAPLRKLLEIPKQWQLFKVTREDIQQNNEIAKAAQTHFGTVPDARILSGEIRPELISKKKLALVNDDDGLSLDEQDQEELNQVI